MKIKHTQSISTRDILASSLPFGVPFIRGGNDRIFVRVKPTGFILNSSIISDVINRGDIMIVDLNTGSLFCCKGDEGVRTIEAELNVIF